MPLQEPVNYNHLEFREFYNQVGDKYPEEELVYKTLKGIVRRKFVVQRLSHMTGVFLDLGCNRGMYTNSSQFKKKVGVDISLPVLKIAKRKNKAFYIQGDAQNLSFIKSQSMDAILCSEVIEHVLRPEFIISECYRVLKTGGKLLVTTPNFKKSRPTWINIGEMADFGVSGIQGHEYYHTAYKPNELQAMAEKAGFSQIEVGTFEKEVKYATRIPVLFFHTIDKLNASFSKSKKVDRFNVKLLNDLSLLIYKTCFRLALNDFFCGMVKEGVRTFLFAKK